MGPGFLVTLAVSQIRTNIAGQAQTQAGKRLEVAISVGKSKAVDALGVFQDRDAPKGGGMTWPQGRRGQKRGRALSKIDMAYMTFLEPTETLPCFRTGDVPKGRNIALSLESRGQKRGHALCEFDAVYLGLAG